MSKNVYIYVVVRLEKCGGGMLICLNNLQSEALHVCNVYNGYNDYYGFYIMWFLYNVVFV